MGSALPFAGANGDSLCGPNEANDPRGSSVPTDSRVPHISWFFREMWEIHGPYPTRSFRLVESFGERATHFPHLAKEPRDMGHPTSLLG